ncbi:MAG TPA: hypothetical protein DE315_02695 [Candidatus Omnitrophica bacterium]|nr:MAG: hypothetical protein A2Y05_04015 [Omnitrophica WOR_2 bacterium GWA2_53_43]HBO97483.1 hypothetical protein [Candidatus Omnitrophota bacterium]HCI44428.1 hypothetical protein [Candidatus Omnitrophota bacterium]
MKRTSLVVLTLVLGLSVNAHAQATGLMEVRNKVLTESREIKALLPATKDVILVSSMVDSCILTASQLDAYFSQLGIFNTIKKDDITPAAVNFLEQWLTGIKNTNDLNIKSLNAVTQGIQAKTKLHLERLTGYFTDLNTQIEQELAQLAALKKALGI